MGILDLGEGVGDGPSKIDGLEDFWYMMIFGKMGKWALFSEKNMLLFQGWGGAWGVGDGTIGSAIRCLGFFKDVFFRPDD